MPSNHTTESATSNASSKISFVVVEGESNFVKPTGLFKHVAGNRKGIGHVIRVDQVPSVCNALAPLKEYRSCRHHRPPDSGAPNYGWRVGPQDHGCDKSESSPARGSGKHCEC